MVNEINSLGISYNHSSQVSSNSTPKKSCLKSIKGREVSLFPSTQTSQVGTETLSNAAEGKKRAVCFGDIKIKTYEKSPIKTYEKSPQESQESQEPKNSDEDSSFEETLLKLSVDEAEEAKRIAEELKAKEPAKQKKLKKPGILNEEEAIQNKLKKQIERRRQALLEAQLKKISDEQNSRQLLEENKEKGKVEKNVFNMLDELESRANNFASFSTLFLTLPVQKNSTETTSAEQPSQQSINTKFEWVFETFNSKIKELNSNQKLMASRILDFDPQNMNNVSLDSIKYIEEQNTLNTVELRKKSIIGKPGSSQQTKNAFSNVLNVAHLLLNIQKPNRSFMLLHNLIQTAWAQRVINNNPRLAMQFNSLYTDSLTKSLEDLAQKTSTDLDRKDLKSCLECLTIIEQGLTNKRALLKDNNTSRTSQFTQIYQNLCERVKSYQYNGNFLPSLDILLALESSKDEQAKNFLNEEGSDVYANILEHLEERAMDSDKLTCDYVLLTQFKQSKEWSKYKSMVNQSGTTAEEFFGLFEKRFQSNTTPMLQSLLNQKNRAFSIRY